MSGKRFLYVLRSDPRENLPLSYPVCPVDGRRCALFDLSGTEGSFFLKAFHYALAYLFSATALGVAGIWIAIPIGWALADMTGLFFLQRAFRSQKPA